MKSFDSVDDSKLWNIIKEMGISDHLTWLLRNLYADRATVITLHGKTDWFKTGKGVWQACILSSFLFNLYAEYIMWNARLDESVWFKRTQAGVLQSSWAGLKLFRKDINNLGYADDTTLMEEGEEELKRFLMKVKGEREKAGLKLNILKTKIMTSGLFTSWQREGENVEAVTDFIFLGSKITANCSHTIKRHLLLGRKAMINLAAY